MTKLLTSILISLALLAMMAGCGGTSPQNLPDPTFRLVNASPDVAGLDLLAEDEVIATGVVYGAISAGVARDPEVTDLNLRPSGTTVPSWTEGFTSALDQDYVVLGWGRQNFGTENLKRLQFTVQSVNRRRPNADRARLYVAHGFLRGTGFETPNITVQNPGDTPAHEIADIAPGGFREYDIESGPQRFQVRRSGTDQVYIEKDLIFERGQVYVMLVTGVEGATGLLAPDVRLLSLPVRD